MKITVLGNNGPYPKAGSACSGYLLENDNTKVLIDCGNGILSRLQKVCNINDLDAIIITHLHSDHVSDMFILKYAIGLNKTNNETNLSLPVYTSTDDEYLIDNMNYNDSFTVNNLSEEKEIDINGLKFKFKRNNHPVETYAVKVTDGLKTLVYSSDTAYYEGFGDFIKGADTLICECGVLEKDRKSDTPHLSAKQASVIATEANINRLILTHFWPEYKQEEILNEARNYYNGILEMSQEMKNYNI